MQQACEYCKNCATDSIVVNNVKVYVCTCCCISIERTGECVVCKERTEKTVVLKSGEVISICDECIKTDVRDFRLSWCK